MPKRILVVDWKALPGALPKKRILHLKCNKDNIFECPVKGCLHVGHRSVRGLRKHINTRHPYYYYHDIKPVVSRTDSSVMPVLKKLRSSTHKIPAFSLQNGIGKDFLEWLKSSCGGGKSSKESIFVGRRAMKYLMVSLGQSSESILQDEHVDCCVGNPQIFMSFLRLITNEWGLSSSGALPYVKSITDLLDFRKASGVHDNTLRSFAVTEVYLRRARENLAKKKKVEYSRNLDLESLIAANSWATLSEMEEVIPYHTPRYETVLKKCIDPNHNSNVSELTFATRFIITFLFLRVKCSRPMTYQYLTVKMVEEAAENGGFVDQTKFKTCDKFVFDTLILTDDVIKILDSYISSIRPLLLPKCEYVVLTCNGTQYKAFGSAMSLLVYQAIGKSVNPTRYRQIIESESYMQLDERERDTVSRDQKHSSGVAKRIYQKRLSRDVAMDARACLQKMTGTERETHTQDLALTVCDITVGDSQPSVSDQASPDRVSPSDKLKNTSPSSSYNNGCNEEVLILSTTVSRPSGDATKVDIDCDAVIDVADENTSSLSSHNSDFDKDTSILSTAASVTPEDTKKVDVDCDVEIDVGDQTDSILSAESTINIDELEIKKEEVEGNANELKLKRFTPEEDIALKAGIKKYGYGKWKNIIADKEFKFHPSRTRDTIRIRAKSLNLLVKSDSTKKISTRSCKSNKNIQNK